MNNYYSNLNNLDQILSDIIVYLYPECLKSDCKNKIDTTSVDKKKLEEYFQLLMNVSFIFKKIIRYELYFSEFYPLTDKITKPEALEHHIHAYLEDMDTLKNKVCHFLGVLKNDLKKIAINKSEIDNALKQFIKKVLKVFDKVSACRNPHHHKGSKFLDSNLVDSNLIHTILQSDSLLRDRFRPEYLEQLKKREIDSFEKAKSNWVALAKDNDKQISGFINETFKRSKDFIYQYLKIKSSEEICPSSEL